MEDAEEPEQAGTVTPMPTVVQDPYIRDNSKADSVMGAHPVSEEIVETIESRAFTLAFDLAAIQAIADGTDILAESQSARLLKETEDLQYYQVDSGVFYRLAAAADMEYDTYIQVEDLQALMEAQTRHFLKDMHGFDGEFENTETLCDVYNSPSVQEGAVCHETEPEDAHYGFVDSRGLVVSKGTHS